MRKKSTKKTILFVPGFVVDVYSEIEAAFIDLCANPAPELRYVWLVPSIRSPMNRFSCRENWDRLREPVWVEQLRRYGIEFVEADIRKINAWHNYQLLRRICRAYDVDAVYTHFGLERFWVTALGKLLGRTTIWNEHWHSLGKRYRYAKRLFYLCFVDAFVAVSGYIARTLPQTIPIHVIPNSIGTHDPETSPEVRRSRARRKLGLPADASIVLMVAQFRREKRHMLALEICQRVVQRCPGAVFVFLGEGNLRQEFLRCAEQSGMAGIIAPGYVAGVDDYYAAADVCMLTSENEPFGYCVLEAMNFCLPMVAFRSGGPAEIVEDGETGVLVEEGDSMRFATELGDLIVNPERRRLLGFNGLRVVRERFNREEWRRAVQLALSEEIDRKLILGSVNETPL